MNDQTIKLARVKPAIQAVAAIKLNTKSKADIERIALQIAQITTSSCYNNIEITDIIITQGGTKDISKRIKTLCENKNFDAILLYSAREVSINEKEYKSFVADMRDWYKLRVLCYK